MALATRLSDLAASAQADAVAALLNGGKLRIYDGAQPATADTAVSGQQLLAELSFGSPAAPSSSEGVVTFNPITQDSSIDETGTATWFRTVAANGTAVVFDGSVGTSGANLNLNNTVLQENAILQITGLTYTVPES